MNHRSVTRILIDHFFRRFFDNDTIQVDGDTQTTVVRAIAIVAVPGLMIAFFLQNRIPCRDRSWGAIEDHYFFVLFSFVVMGAVCDLRVGDAVSRSPRSSSCLPPLPMKPLQMLAAKATASDRFPRAVSVRLQLLRDV